MSIERTYTGRAGQRAFIAEVLYRNCNAAIPEVDEGLDTFVFRDDEDAQARVQIKTGRAEQYKKGDGYHTQYAISLKQLRRDDKPPLFYAMVLRIEGGLGAILIVPRADVQRFWGGPLAFGTEASGNLILHVQYRDKILCGDIDLTTYRGAWNLLPPFQALASDGSV